MHLKIQRVFVCALLTTLSAAAIAQSSADAEKQAYCQYVQDQADAERTLDTGVEGFGRLGQSDSNPSLKQVVVGLSKSLSKHLQGMSATRAAQLECELYGRTLSVDRAVKYGMPAIDKQLAVAQAADLKDVVDILNEEIESADKRLRSGNGVLSDVLTLRQQRDQVLTQYTAAKTEVASQQIPDVPQIDLKQALARIDETTLDLQDELNHKQKLQAWDVSLVGGMQKPISGVPVNTSTGYQPFVSVTFTYNFNAVSYGRKLDNATRSLMTMRRQLNDELAQKVDGMQRSMADRLSVQKESLPSLLDEQSRLSGEYERLRKLDSPEALRMKSLIRVSLAMAAMKVHLARLQITLLTQNYAQDQ
ncbi:hypothetical protein [Paraburkholderia hospita]|uniref:hypothetical protein n=1 Tax=Paraburkholderia hospita TaxID=169430 RepID=UPI000B3429DA|nr:hypothetical protein [Paraburkholderia hospita]OUL92992.1 hypothetical protein CA601_11090 [Paraburkholderia hospita]